MDAEPVPLRHHPHLRRRRDGLAVRGIEPREIAFAWYDGFWVLLTFAMQMVIILVTGSWLRTTRS